MLLFYQTFDTVVASGYYVIYLSSHSLHVITSDRKDKTEIILRCNYSAAVLIIFDKITLKSA